MYLIVDHSHWVLVTVTECWSRSLHVGHGHWVLVTVTACWSRSLHVGHSHWVLVTVVTVTECWSQSLYVGHGHWVLVTVTVCLIFTLISSAGRRFRHRHVCCQQRWRRKLPWVVPSACVCMYVCMYECMCMMSGFVYMPMWVYICIYIDISCELVAIKTDWEGPGKWSCLRACMYGCWYEHSGERLTDRFTYTWIHNIRIYTYTSPNTCTRTGGDVAPLSSPTHHGYKICIHTYMHAYIHTYIHT